MFPSTIIPALNIVKRGQLCLVAHFKVNVINHLTFEPLEKLSATPLSHRTAASAVTFSATGQPAPLYFIKLVTPLVDSETQYRHIAHPDQTGSSER